ncbi:MAG: glycosyltransferase family A protein [Ilumatobacteraceae bacterium]
MADEVDVTVVLPVFNGERTVGDELAAVLGQITHFSFELVVVDNDSTDNTPAIVDTLVGSDRRVRRVVAPDQHNLSYVRNVGVAAARGRYVLFCDDDDVVDPGWLQAMATGLTEHRLVASRMEYGHLTPPEVMRGRAEFQSDGLADLFGYVVSNGAIGVHRDLWNSLGGNDEHLGVAGEDFDFAIRAQRDAGVAPVFIDTAIYHYRQRAGAKSTWTQARRYGHSHVALYRRYGQGRVDLSAERKRAVREWWWIITRAPLLMQPRRRVRWARKAGMRVGRLTGSLQERILYV